MKQITEIGDCYPTYEQCVELEKYRKRATFAHWYKSHDSTTEICIEYYWKNDGAEINERVGCPSVPELEAEIREMQQKHIFATPMILNIPDAYLERRFIECNLNIEPEITGSTMAQAYAALLLNLYAKYEPIKPE